MLINSTLKATELETAKAAAAADLNKEDPTEDEAQERIKANSIPIPSGYPVADLEIVNGY